VNKSETEGQLDMKRNGRNRGGWSKASLAYLENVRTVLDGLADYWPLTLRQVYYQLVAVGMIANSLAEYDKLSRMLSKARLDGRTPWGAIEDRTRAILHSGGWQDMKEFVSQEKENFLTGYRRDLLQTQAAALEVWVEKDALSRVCYNVAFPYCVPVIVARGFSSISYVHECRKRVKQNIKNGKRTVILYFGDLDPSGWEMLPAMLETLQNEMSLGDLVEGKRYALTTAQVEMYGLPRNPDALKLTDTRAKKYMEQFGDLAVELDALPPAILEALVEQAIKENLDKTKFEAERRQEAAERADLTAMRTHVCNLI
jgi:hypothetical protein